MNVNSKVAVIALALLMITSTVPPGMIGTSEAQSASSTYTVIQGSNCWEVVPYQPGDTNPEGPPSDPTIKPHVEVIESSHELGPTRAENWTGPATIESVMDYRYRDPAGGVHDNDFAWGQREHSAPYLDEDYRAEGWEYGTYGLWNWSENQESHMFFYDGPEGDSVVFRHDKLYDSTRTGSHDPYNGLNGPQSGFMSPQPGASAASFIFRNLPAGEWAYMDDLYPEGMDSIYYASGEFNYDSSRHTRYGSRHNDYDAAPLENYGGGTDFTAHWTWGPHGTDGGAYRGLQNLGAGESITIEPYFDEESYFWDRRGSLYDRSDGDGVTDWVVRRKNGENINLDKTEAVEIRRGSHCPTANFQLGTTSGSNVVEVGEQFVLDGRNSGGNDIQYNWDLDGDGQFENATGSYLTHSYDGNVTGNVTVTLTVEDADGLRNTATRQIEVRQAESPDANATVTGTNENSFDAHHVVGETLTFDGSGTIDNVGLNGSSAVWRVNGNVTATGQMQFARAFDETDEYNVSFTISDYAGHSTTETMRVEVKELDTEDPEANAETTPQEVEVGAPLTLDGSESDDTRGIAAYQWDYTGDGSYEESTTNDTLMLPSEPYGSAGTYNLTLRVVDANGNTDNETVPVTVLQPQAPNVTGVDVPSDVSAGEEFQVSAGVEDNGQVERVTYRFSNADPKTAEPGESVTHTFDNPGRAVLVVEVLDRAGNSNATGEIPINVTQEPAAALSLTTNGTAPNGTETGENVTFDASASSDNGDIEEYQWNFDGDSDVDRTTNASQPVVTHAYDSGGTYDAEVTVVDDSGLTDTATAQIEIEEDEQALDNGGSGGGGSVNVGPPPVSKDTQQIGPNAATIDVRNAHGDETIRSDLPDTQVAEQTGVTFERLAVNLPSDNPHVVFETAASAERPDGVGELTATHETLAYLELGGKYLGGVENATVEFAVQKGAISGLAGPDDVVVYQYGGGAWTQVNATVVETEGDAYQLSATTDSLGTFAVGTDHSFTVTDTELAADTVTTGETLTANATIENDGETTETGTVELAVDGNVVAAETVEVAPGETTQVTLRGTAPSTGTYEATIGGVSLGEVEVVEPKPADVSVADASVNESTIAAGEQVAITATVENAGGETGEQTVTLTLFGEQLENETVQVEGGETKQVTFVRQIDASGTYTAEVGDETVEIEVTDSDDDGLTPEAPDVPGFGVGAALVALLAAALLARLRS
jgi:PGF-CTERM protein